MPQLPDWCSLDRYLAGDASPAESAAVQAWLDADPARADTLAALRAESAGDPVTPDVDAAWARLAPRLEDREIPSATRMVSHSPRPRSTFPSASTTHGWIGIAAAALIALGLGAAAWRALGSAAHPRVAVAARPTRPAREIVVPNGARASATLEDGTLVTIDAGSRLRVAAEFGRASRDVWLEGAAYFEVTHDAARPFRVHAGGGIAEDMGTKFTVRAYPERPRLDVMVAEGRVALSRERATTAGAAAVSAVRAQVAPGQIGRLGAEGEPEVLDGASTERWLAFTRGVLVLDGLTLDDAVPQIERWFDVRVKLADPGLASRRVAARFHGESAAQAFDALALALGARWSRDGRVITLTASHR